jgi:hypothetical protein
MSGHSKIGFAKLYDDRGNLMSPSFSRKNGVRYRFYVNSALLRGRKDKAGSVRRIAAREIEGVVEEDRSRKVGYRRCFGSGHYRSD